MGQKLTNQSALKLFNKWRKKINK